VVKGQFDHRKKQPVDQEKKKSVKAATLTDKEQNNRANSPKTQENYNMKKTKKPDVKSMLSAVAIKPGDMPTIKFEHKRNTIKASTSIPKNTFFRIHSDYEQQFMMISFGKGMDTKMYIIGPGLTLPAHLSESITPICCHLLVFTDGELQIFERKTAVPGEPLNEYQQSSLNVVNAAKNRWVMRQWNRNSGVFDHVEADEEYAPSPVWPDDDFMDLLTIAYEGRMITSVDDPVYMELAGKKAKTDID